MFRFLFLLVLFSATYKSDGQDQLLDSLKARLESVNPRDTLFVDIANEIAFKLSQTDQQKSIYYINLAIERSKEIGYEKGLLRATIIKGSSFLIVGLPDQALSYYLEALSYNPQKYPINHVRLNNNIGEVYRRKQLYDSSLKYFSAALSIIKSKLPENLPVIILSNLGEVNLALNDTAAAEKNFQQCLDNAYASGNKRGLGYGYFGLAECAFYRGNATKAISLMKESIAVRKEIGHKRGLIQSYLKIGTYFSDSKVQLQDSALHYWKKSENLAKQYSANDLLNETYDQLYSFYLKLNDIPNAATYLKKHKNLGDSIQNAEFISNVEKMKSALQSELIVSENELLKQRQLQMRSEEEARLIVITLAFFIVIGLGVVTFQYRKRQKALNEATIESNYTKTLLSLSNVLNKQDLDLKIFVQRLLDESRRDINCDRATYWSMNPEKQFIYLDSISQKESATKIPSVEFSRNEFPGFFDDFMTQRTVAVSRISKDARLADIYDSYFKPFGIESILNAPILIDEKFVGFISYTMTHGEIREWDVQDQRFVGSLADLINVAIAKHKGNMLEQEKGELIKKLKSRNKSLQEFNSVISHNLREPLTQIIGFADILQNSKNEIKNSATIVERIGNASNKIDKVIKELSIVLNEKDPKRSEFRTLSLDRLIKEVLDLLKAEIKSQNMTFESDLRITKIKSYKPFLSDVLYHLIGNSIKFSDPERRLHIRLESFENETHLCLKLSDNGRGMDLDKFGDKVFKMYQRFHLDTEGRGMGLFIVKTRVNALNGWIKVESKEGEGTSFLLEFPKEKILIN